MTEEQKWAKEEILIACKSLRDGVEFERKEGRANGFHDSVDTLAQAMIEFLDSLSASGTSEERKDAVKLMRESVDSLKRHMGLP